MNNGTFQGMVERELQRARTIHPGRLHSLHEAHSVIEEEYDECWDAIKTSPRNRLEILKELTHLAAMCQRTAEDVLGVEQPANQAEKVLVLGGGAE